MLSRPMFDRFALGPVTWYGVLIVAAIVIGLALSIREAWKRGYSSDLMLDVLLFGIPLAIIGARLYYVFFRFGDFSEDLLSIFNLREGGLAIYGGILGGLLACRIVARRHRIPLGRLLDMIAPSLALGQAIGRWGNYINMEAYGLRISDEALQFFPFAVEVPLGNVWYWHMATFFYESCWCVLVFLVLQLLVRRHIRRDGDGFLWYLLLYCSGRTVIEGLRDDSLTFISEFVRISQVLSAICALCVVVVFFVRIRDRFSVVTLLPLVTAVVAFAEVFLGEFERGAYSTLFPVCQFYLFLLLVLQVLTIVFCSMDSGYFETRVALLMMPNMFFVIMLILTGFGRDNLDNTYYVTLRQCTCMLQIILSGWLCCYYFSPLSRGREDGE